MEDLRAAIVGYGLAGRFFHAPLIASTNGLSVSTVVTSDPARQAQVAREHPAARAVASPAELWELGDHDLVVVATPNGTPSRIGGGIPISSRSSGCWPKVSGRRFPLRVAL